MIMGQVAYGWPTSFTMEKWWPILCHTLCDVCPKSKVASIVKPLGCHIK